MRLTRNASTGTREVRSAPSTVLWRSRPTATCCGWRPSRPSTSRPRSLPTVFTLSTRTSGSRTTCVSGAPLFAIALTDSLTTGPAALAVFQLVRRRSQRAEDEELRLGPRQARLCLAVHHRGSSRRCPDHAERRRLTLCAQLAGLHSNAYISDLFAKGFAQVGLPRERREGMISDSPWSEFPLTGWHEGLRQRRAVARARDWLRRPHPPEGESPVASERSRRC